MTTSTSTTATLSPRGSDARVEVTLREPELRDGAAVWRMVADSGALDPNSPYAYLLLCDYFSETSIVAEIDGAYAGFVCGFRPPKRPDALFVWQVGVDGAHRGLGLARRMILELARRNEGVRFVEATVTPSNEPSTRLFRSLAEHLDTECVETPYIPAELFPADGSGATHESETLFRIGPFAEAQ